MKMFRKTTFLFTILLVFNGCYKDSFQFMPNPEPDPPVEEPKGDIEEFFSSIEKPFDSIQVDLSEDVVIVTDNKTVIRLSENSLVREDGKIAEGNIQFKYLELLNPAEYAFYNLPTISNGRRLRTEGVFRFEAFQEGMPLKLREGKGITVRLPDEAPEFGMELFYGEGEGDNFNWERATDNTGVDANLMITEWAINLDTSQQEFIEGFGYLFTCDLFKWINVDIFADIPEDEKTRVCVELPEKYTPKNTVAFMFFNGEKSILGLYPNSDEEKWCEPYGATPKGYTVTLFTISSLGEDIFHFGKAEVEVSDNLNVFLEPEEKSLEEIIEIIKKLE